jgi:hypothetical protein
MKVSDGYKSKINNTSYFTRHVTKCQSYVALPQCILEHLLIRLNYIYNDDNKNNDENKTLIIIIAMMMTTMTTKYFIDYDFA